MSYLLKLAQAIDVIADKVEASGNIREAFELDKISDTLEAMNNFPPEAVQLARELGVTLNKDNAAKIVQQYLNPKMLDDMEAKEALNVNPKLRQFALLAAMLASAFVSEVQAKGKPITVRFPTGTVTYSAKDLKQLEKGDPKTFAVVMDSYNKQEAERQGLRRQDSITVDRNKNQPKPGFDQKVTKNVEELSDEFGNEARLITYNDGTKRMEGDILHGGVSLRDKLTRSGEIPHEPNAPRVKTDKSNLP